MLSKRNLFDTKYMKNSKLSGLFLEKTKKLSKKHHYLISIIKIIIRVQNLVYIYILLSGLG